MIKSKHLCSVISSTLDLILNLTLIIILVSSVVMISSFTVTLADNIAPEAQTQVNKRTDLFEKSIDDLPTVKKRLEDSKQGAIRSLGDGSSSDPQGLSSITKHRGSELNAKTKDLESISEHELNSRGRAEMIKNNTINELYPDYKRPLNKQYMEDAKALAAGQNKLLANLLGKLKELGVDCKTVKGDLKQEPEYFLKVKTTDHKDTVYDKYMCEQLRNTYSCGDTLNMSCKTKGILWGEWQDKVITVPGEELVNYKNDLLEGDHVADRTFEFKLFIGGKTGLFRERKIAPNPALVDRARVYLSTKHENATIDNIDTTMRAEWFGGIHSISGREYGGRTLGSKDYVWANYIIYYRYRDGKPACLEWREEWSEQCTLK